MSSSRHRLHIDTTNSGLKASLEKAGMKEVKCHRIQPKVGKTYKTAAFQDSCNPASCNAILGNSVCQTELARLSLTKSYCLPVFQYCTSAVYLNVTQLSKLNACWNMVYSKIFGFPKWESLKLFIAGLG